MTTSILCPNCETASPFGSRFCRGCGEPLAPALRLAPRPPESERFVVHDVYFFGETIPLPGQRARPAEPDARPQARRPRGVPVTPLAVAALLLLGALVLGGVLFVVPAIADSRLPEGTALEGGAPGSEAQVIEAIAAANRAHIEALRQVNAGLLEGKMTGSALDENKQMVRALRSNDAYQVAEMLDISYGPVQFRDADHAVVRTVERWRSGIYKEDGSLMQASGPDTLYEVYYLVRKNRNWLIERIDITPAGEDPQPPQD